MAIINSLPVALLQQADWNVVTYTFSSTGNTQSISFTVTAEPKQWCLFGAQSTNYYTGACIAGIYYDGSSFTAGNISNTSTVAALGRFTSGLSTTYNSGTHVFTVSTSNKYFAKGYGKNYYTYYLFYTV